MTLLQRNRGPGVLTYVPIPTSPLLHFHYFPHTSSFMPIKLKKNVFSGKYLLEKISSLFSIIYHVSHPSFEGGFHASNILHIHSFCHPFYYFLDAIQNSKELFLEPLPRTQCLYPSPFKFTYWSLRVMIFGEKALGRLLDLDEVVNNSRSWSASSWWYS